MTTSSSRVGGWGGGGNDGGNDGGDGGDGRKRGMVVRPQLIVGAEIAPQGAGVARGCIVDCVDDMMNDANAKTARYNQASGYRGAYFCFQGAYVPLMHPKKKGAARQE